MLEMMVLVTEMTIWGGGGGSKRHLLQLLHPSPVVDGVGAGHAFYYPRCRQVAGRQEEITSTIANNLN